MTIDTYPPASATLAEVDPALYDGWQALALATRGRPLTETELAAIDRLPAALSLDLLFPDLGDAARHEALWALG